MLELLGYLASLIVLISLLMSSVKRLRWINLIGASVFAIYGFLIQAYPVGLMNAGIVMINVYYLSQMYTKKDYFTLLKLNNETDYFNHFMSFYKENMRSFMEVEDSIDDPNHVRLFILRNTVPAGIVISKIIDQKTLEILVDYAVPAYRDFKLGHFLYDNQKDFFISQGYDKLISKPGNDKHESYLKKMGFIAETMQGTLYYVKNLKS